MGALLHFGSETSVCSWARRSADFAGDCSDEISRNCQQVVFVEYGSGSILCAQEVRLSDPANHQPCC